VIIDGREHTLNKTTSEVVDGSYVLHLHYMDAAGKETVITTRDSGTSWGVDRLDSEPPDYRERRRRAYPPIGDQLDAIWKALGWLQMKKKINLVGEADLLMGRILNVKKRYPKPEPVEE